MTFTAPQDLSSDAYDPDGNDPEPSPSTELLRLMLFPAIVGMLFIGGVYWLRLQVAAGGGAPESTTLVQVHLLPRPDPIPVPVAPGDPIGCGERPQSNQRSDGSPGSRRQPVPGRVADRGADGFAASRPEHEPAVLDGRAADARHAGIPERASAPHRTVSAIPQSGPSPNDCKARCARSSRSAGTGSSWAHG